MKGLKEAIGVHGCVLCVRVCVYAVMCCAVLHPGHMGSETDPSNPLTFAYHHFVPGKQHLKYELSSNHIHIA